MARITKPQLNKDCNGNYIVTGNDLGDYFSRFEEYIRSNSANIPDDEIFLQCRSTYHDLKYFNPSWFVSNYGYVLSFARKEPKILKPIIKPDKLKYRFLRNTYSNKWVQLHKLVALYHNYSPKGQYNYDELEVHHVYKDSETMDVSEFNSSKSLQLLTRSQHSELTNVEIKGEKVFDKKFQAGKEILSKQAGIISLSLDDMKDMLKEYVAEHDDAYMVLVNEDGTVEKAKYITLEDIK